MVDLKRVSKQVFLFSFKSASLSSNENTSSVINTFLNTLISLILGLRKVSVFTKSGSYFIGQVVKVVSSYLHGTSLMANILYFLFLEF